MYAKHKFNIYKWEIDDVGAHFLVRRILAHLQLDHVQWRTLFLRRHEIRLVRCDLRFDQRLGLPALDDLSAQHNHLASIGQTVPRRVLEVVRLTELGHCLVGMVDHWFVFVAEAGFVWIRLVADVPIGIQVGKDV